MRHDDHSCGGPRWNDGFTGLYELAQKQGFRGTEREFLFWLRGPAGKSAYEGAVESGLFTGSEEEFYYMLSLAGTFSFWVGTKDEFNSLTVDEMYAEKVIHFIIEGE